MVSSSSSGQTIRRVVDGASLILLEALKRSVPSDQPSAAVLSQSLKTIALSATDLLGITSGRVHQYSSRPSSSSSSVSSSPKTTSSSSSSSSYSVVYFSNHENENGNKNEHTQQPIPSPAATADDNDDDGSSRREIVDCNLDDAPSLEDKYDNSMGLATVAVVKEDDEGEEGKENKNKKSKEEDLSLLPMKNRRRPRERRVPSTPIGRALGFAGLGAGLAWGTIQESTRRFVFGSPNSKDKHSAVSPFLSEQNAERLALALCRMRGAALKLGQMLSIQDESLIPAPILSALDIVRQGADVMPRSQLNDVLDAELGPNWSKKLKSFDYEPLAAASIGQVHHAVMLDDMGVAMKIQYPGVADSIDSDIENVRQLLDYTNVIPKGLFLDRAIKVAKEELSRECDYELEAKSQKRFRELLSSTEGVYVPMVINEISSRRVLTTELITGIPIDKVAALNQETRNYVGRKLLEVTLKELFVFRFMQTDPNWSNFLFNEATKMINLIDFGAAREYRKGFVDDYLRMVLACANRDRDAVIEMSTRLGFLTGMESEIMLDAHVQASFIVGLPFSTSDAYDFRSSNITSSISHLGSTMLKHRLTPPPDEAYSLHRKLSGAFLACIKLGVAVPCRDLLLQVYQQYHFSDENEETAVVS